MKESPGNFGPFEVRGLLGRGGMGQVYLAEDPRLRRNVAIKVLPGAHALDPEKKERFLAEARAASALNHPNIVTIFDLGHDHGADYLVMEHVDGPPLREVLRKRRLKPQESLEIAAQIASGLAAAHAKGIVHRDIKPGNVVLAPDGTAKILDYGVAILLDSSGPDASTAHRLTAPGALVGTIAYMSPEQVQAQIVDHRSDIFSLGVVLWEMLSGKNPFEADSLSGTVGRIVASPPPVEELPASVPQRVREIVARALALRPADRYQCARDLELDLRAAIGTTAATVAATTEPARASRVRGVVVALACVGAAALAVIADRIWLNKREEALPRLSFAPLTSDPGYEGEPTFSADSQTIAYVSDRAGNFDIFLKQISGGPDINLTNHPGDDVQPAFSPDGKQIAFVSTRSSETSLLYRNPTIDAMGGDIWVMSALGGSPRRIVQGGNFPAWSPDGASIVFVRGGWSAQNLYRVAASGGTPVVIPMTLPARPLFLTTPQYSRDGKWLSFSSHQPNNVCVMPAAGGAATAVAEGRHAAWKADSRSIIYSDLAPGRNGSLSLIRIDGAGKPAGASVPVTSGGGADRTPAVAPDGRTIIFSSQTISFNVERVAFDQEAGVATGPPEPITRGGDFCPFFSVAPDGTAIVFQSQRGLRPTLWKQEIASGALTQLAGDDKAAYSLPVWSPDGRRIAFHRTESGGLSGIWVMDSDGANPHEVVAASGFVSWSPDGRGLAHFDFQHKDVRLLDLATKKVRVLANEGTIRTFQKFSADGKWMLYQAIGPTGLTEVRVVAVGDTRSRVLVRGPRENLHPFFSADLRWVYFQPDHKNLHRIPGPAQGWKSAPPQQVTFFRESDLYLEDPQLSTSDSYLYYSRRSAASDLWVGKDGS
ncbi:MAG: serine/threonine-protein kinase [Thermoanaerobaculia bacterium]|nr:serine/threonine-protein kinase [Thermoanaerobaculia bacterium]